MNKAVIPVIIIIILLVAATFILGSGPAATETTAPVTVYINDEAFNTNLTEPRTIEWGAVQPGNTYTRNFTVANNQNQTLNLQLFTTEPVGNTQSWPYNNTQIQPLESLKGTLSLTLKTVAASGVYTWRLFAINGSAPLPSPSPTPTATPTAEDNTIFQFTVTADAGYQNITVSINTDKITLVMGDLPSTFTCKASDTLTFKTEASEGYIFNTWLLDESTPKSSNPLVLTALSGNFTIRAKYLLNTP